MVSPCSMLFLFQDVKNISNEYAEHDDSSLMINKDRETNEYAEHDDSSLMINEDRETPRSFAVTVIGVKQTIIEVAQQLAWLTAALRSSHSGLALSNVDFIATEGAQFYIEPGALRDVGDTTDAQEECWHRLVRNAPIAQGFPIPTRGLQVGLEIPLAAMLKLSHATNFLVTNKRLAFYGLSSMLFPTDRHVDETDDATSQKQLSIQWHFERSEESSRYFDCADYLAESKCIWTNAVDEHSLTTSRHFVGLCRVAKFQLATANSDYGNLDESPLPPASSVAGARIESVTLGTSGMGFGTAELESSIRYPHGIVNPVAADEYLSVLDTTKRMAMILWDAQDQCGWLVPAQALLLHMAHKWVRTNGNTAANFRYASDGPSYLEHVGDILSEDRRKVVRVEGRDDDTDMELRHLIMRFWTDIRGCILAQQSALRDDSGVIGYQSGKLSGWELADFITRPPFQFAMRQDQRGPSDRTWKGLAVEKNIPVLFCQGAGDVILASTAGFICSQCLLSLKRECHLVASLTCLDHLAKKYGGFRTRTRLTQEWEWRPADEQILFEEHCQSHTGRKCHERIQKLVSVGDHEQGTSLALPVTGAVVFGKPDPKPQPSGNLAPGQQTGAAVPIKPGLLGKSKFLQRLSRKIKSR